MKCEKCGQEMGNAAFCSSCGSPLPSKKCAGCGAQLKEGDRFCANCGMEQQPVWNGAQATAKKPKRKKAGWIFAIFLLFFAGFAVAVNRPGEVQPSSAQEQQTQPLYDVSQFANISKSELVELLGEPNRQSEGNCTGAFEIPCITYDYDDADTLGSVSFVLVNDKVVRMTAYGEYQYASGDAIWKQLGIEPQKGYARTADTGVTQRYAGVTDQIDEVQIGLIEKEKDTFGFLQATYQMCYYEEWYLPMDTSEKVEMQLLTEDAVKKILKAPSAAKFGDFQYGKNLFYLAVQSYVDAPNAFGVQLRNEFTFIYDRATRSLIYAVFGGEVLVDNGYVRTEELVMQLADTAASGAQNTEQLPDSSYAQTQAASPELSGSQQMAAQTPTEPQQAVSDPPAGYLEENVVYYHDISEDPDAKEYTGYDRFALADTEVDFSDFS